MHVHFPQLKYILLSWLSACTADSRPNSCVELFFFFLLEFQFNLLNGLKIDLRICVCMLSIIVYILCLVISEMYAWMDQIYFRLRFSFSFRLFLLFFLLHLSSIFPTHRFIVFPVFHLDFLFLVMHLLLYFIPAGIHCMCTLQILCVF